MTKELHDAIMNLPNSIGNAYNERERHAYKNGHRDARHAAAELALSQTAPGWQLIEMAPKDGSTVIISSADGGTGEGFWNDGAECYGHRGGAGWFWEGDRSGLLTASNAHPTHWMPLPPAPKAEEQS